MSARPTPLAQQGRRTEMPRGRFRRSGYALIATPARMLVTMWLTFALVYVVGPVIYVRHFNAYAAWMSIACIAAFCTGSFFVTSRATAREAAVAGEISDGRVERAIVVCSVVALIGGSMIILDKLAFSGLDFSSGITSVRFQRAADTENNLAPNRTPLLYLGYPFYSFGVVSYLLYLLRGDALSRHSAWWGHLGLIAPIAVATVYGGRSGLMLIIVLALGAMYLRRTANQSWLPRDGFSVWALAVGGVAFLTYTSYIFAARREYVGLVALADYMDAMSASGMEAEPWVRTLTDALGPAPTLELLSIGMYLTNGINTLGVVVASVAGLGPYYGQYQFFLIAQTIGRIVPSFSLERQMMADIKGARLDGLFNTAWSGMILDFGMIGGLIATLVLGALCGWIWRRARNEQNLGFRLLLCFVFAWVGFSPLHTGFSVSNSVLVLLSMIVVAVALRPRRVAGPSRTAGKAGGPS